MVSFGVHVQQSLSQSPDLSAQIQTDRITVANNNNVVNCSNLPTQPILNTSRTTQTAIQEHLQNVQPTKSQIMQNTNTPNTIFIIKLHNKKAVYQSTNTNNQTVSILLDIYTKTHHKLPLHVE